MSELKFAIMYSYKQGINHSDQEYLSSNDFQTDNNEWQHNSNSNKDFIYKLRVVLNEKYFFMLADCGKTKPRRDKIIDKNTGETRDNQRQENEAELTEQIFCLFDFENKCIYLSNQNQKNTIKEIVKQHFNITIMIKNIYVNIEEFTKQLSVCKEISFTGINDLFSGDGNIKNSIINLTGTDSPEKFKIVANYSNKYAIPFIKKLYESFNRSEIQSLTVRGKDDNDMETVYNTDTFIKKIKIKTLNKNDEFVYDFNEVYDKLINEIERIL